MKYFQPSITDGRSHPTQKDSKIILNNVNVVTIFTFYNFFQDLPHNTSKDLSLQKSDQEYTVSY